MKTGVWILGVVLSLCLIGLIIFLILKMRAGFTPEVYVVGLEERPREFARQSDAREIAHLFGAKLASYQQLIDGWRHGADWCLPGWSGDLEKSSVFPHQGDGKCSLCRGKQCTHSDLVHPLGGEDPQKLAGVLLYGEKPSHGTRKVWGDKTLVPLRFNARKWSQHGQT